MTAPARPAKYMFDIAFDGGPLAVLGSGAKAALDTAEKEAYRRGYEAAKKEAEQRCADQLSRIAADIHLVVGRLAATETRLEREAIDVACAVANQLSSALIARQPLAEIEALVLDVLSHVRAAPHVAVRVAPEMSEGAAARLRKLAEERGFASRLVILPDPNLKGDDCLIEWADGGVAREAQAIQQRIAEAIQNFLGAGNTAPKVPEK